MVIISRNITVCKNVFKKATGLMFTKQKKDFAYVFSFNRVQRMRITMWWVFYPIDIIFLDEQGYIVELVSWLKPFGFYTSKRKAKTFVELPSGVIQKYGLMKGMHCSWNGSFFLCD
ncbi:MAG: DUF192 domain-containing protein [Candidatus Woesearchaeota archaeon]